MLARNGFHVADILAEHPKLVWCTITGFGSQSDRAGYDFVQLRCDSGEMEGELAAAELSSRYRGWEVSLIGSRCGAFAPAIAALTRVKLANRPARSKQELG